MKLYNLYQEVILEETQKRLNLLSEGISDSEVKAAIKGKYNVNIYYRDEEGQPPTKRYIQIYTLGQTVAGNLAIRAYQIGGYTNSPKTENIWKTFRLDRIESLEPTGAKWYKPVSDSRIDIPKYIDNGDKTFSSIIMQVNPEEFQKYRERIMAKQQPQTVNRKPEPEVEKEPIVNKPETPRVNNKVEPSILANEPNPVQTEPEVGDNEEELEKDIYGNTTTS